MDAAVLFGNKGTPIFFMHVEGTITLNKLGGHAPCFAHSSLVGEGAHIHLVIFRGDATDKCTRSGK